MTPEIKTNIDTLWTYNQLNQVVPRRADAIIVPGCRDLGVVERAAELYRENRAEIIVMSGEHGTMTHNVFADTEAVTFARRAVELGVDPAACFLEERATNTGENVQFSERLLCELGRKAMSAIVVQKPYLERRVHATLEQQWSDQQAQLTVTSQRHNNGDVFSFDDYCAIRRANPLDIAQYLVDTTDRIVVYPELGFQSPQPIDSATVNALRSLRSYLQSLSRDAYAA